MAILQNPVLTEVNISLHLCSILISLLLPQYNICIITGHSIGFLKLWNDYNSQIIQSGLILNALF